MNKVWYLEKLRGSKLHAIVCITLGLSLTEAPAQTILPEALRTPGEQVILSMHAEGVQIYECKADSTARLQWSFREPIATLLVDGKTVGRHYAGPTWELMDGSMVQGRVSGRAPGERSSDIPWLKLDVVFRKGQGQLSEVATILRTTTVGGMFEGPCEKVGDYRSVVYSAKYQFLR